MSFRSAIRQRARMRRGAAACALIAGLVCVARADLPEWMQHAVSGSMVEAALYRMMDLPGMQALYPRPPKQAADDLGGLIAKSPNEVELYSLRAMEEEKALDFAAAEADWKVFAAKSGDPASGTLALADYYHRRLRAVDEAAALMAVAKAPSLAVAYQSPDSERSWQAFERLIALAADQALPDATVDATYAAWIARYPNQPVVYTRDLHWLLSRKRFADAATLIAQYRTAFPRDEDFPVQAAALVELDRGNGDAGSVEKALATYDAAFQPLWSAELVQSFYSLLDETHQQRHFLADARERLSKNPDDVNALARIFYYYQQEGHLDTAEQEVAAFRMSKDARKAAWSAQDLYTLATMMDGAGAYPEEARYDYALYHASGTLPSGETAREAGLTGMIALLFKARDQPIALGQGNLSMYRDIATLDRGPGYWNGILSLWFNSDDPAQEFSQEEQKAQPYFYRKKAAELLTLMDQAIPNAAARPELHAELIDVYAEYGQTAAVIQAGQEFLREFPAAAERVQVANTMADAYARLQDPKSEFALYDRMLVELAAKAGNMPLTDAASGSSTERAPAPILPVADASVAESQDTGDESAAAPQAKRGNSRAFEIATNAAPVAPSNEAAQEYSRMLDRYLGRLAAMNELPQALAVLRHELERNPGDPLLYERLADFLRQNNLSAQEEEVYRQALGKFPDKSWYDRLARLYLRERRREDFAALTRQVADTFDGTELDRYFANVPAGGPPPGPAMYLELNLYAHKRFPHDMVFVNNLLSAYQARATSDPAAWEALIRQHWWESDGLRREFFDFLSRTGRLDTELAQLQQIVVKDGAANDPAATRELADVYLWDSHFEQSAPLLDTLVSSYPADPAVGSEAVSVFRSLAYYDASQTTKAVDVEKNLLAADPYDTEALGTLGDLYAEQKAGGHEDLAAAAPYWRRIPAVHPGQPEGYLDAATIFWDYFEFDDALGEIHQARTKFGRPALYGYEAGAIAEGKRDPAAAVAEYTTAALAGSSADDAARTRLLELARRPAYRTLADQETARQVALDSDSAAALGLRADVLVAIGRATEIAPMLSAAMARATNVDDTAEIAELAQAHQLTPLYEQALAREAALASDPVQKMQIEYAAARSMEGRGDVAGATALIEAVYRENPKILGVVRSTVDFDWRNGRREDAIAALRTAAGESQPGLAAQFTLEAANKANEAGNTAEARELAMTLLTQSPFDARYVAAAAESYARAGDDAGLKQFYLGRLELVKTTAGLTGDQRKQDTAVLRRGLIPALTRTKDTSGALDQYLAILSAYPEDVGTAQEAALYALSNGLEPQLLSFLEKTVHDSPQDSRFAILLAQTQVTFANLPAAVAAYTQAIAVRKDRVDLYEARAQLEERLQRFDEACADFERLYVLTYKDPDWMVKEAELRARQGRTEDAVRGLETAWVTGRPASAKNEFLVATQLEKWNLLSEASQYADKGLTLAGDDLLLPSNEGTDASDAATYSRIETRLGQPDRALTILLAARKAAETLPAPAMPAADDLNNAHLSLTDWRRMQTERRRNAAAGPFQAAMTALGTTVAKYYTPEQKLAYAQVLAAHRQAGDLSADLAIGQASLAGLKDREAAWRKEEIMAASEQTRLPREIGAYEELQRARMEFAELGSTAEAYALTRPLAQRQGLWLAAADAFHDLGDTASEMQALKNILDENYASPEIQQRYLALVLKRTPATLATLAAGPNEALANAAVNLALAQGGDALAQQALDARGQVMQPVWRRSYTALVGLYLGDKSQRTDGAFREALDDTTIGERLGHPTDRAQQLTGDTWFYYGMRYGVYRTISAQGDAEDYLPAQVERSPAAEESYTGLARAYVDAGKTDAALTEYGHALELAPDDAGVPNEMAVVLWSAGRKSEALARWRGALAILQRIQDRGVAPESFWSDFAAVLKSLGSRSLTESMQPEVDAILRPYIARNGGYRTSELLEDVYRASSTPAKGVAWILSLSEAGKSPLDVLDSVANAGWLPDDQQELVFLRRIELARVDAAKATSSDDYAITRLRDLQRALVLFYINQREDAKARTALDAIPQEQRKTDDLESARIVLAARAGGLNALLAQYRADPGNAPDVPVLQSAVHALVNPAFKIGMPQYGANQNEEAVGLASGTETGNGTGVTAVSDWPDARAILEYVFEREQRSHTEIATDLLALADARLHTGDMNGELTALRRMTTLEGDVYANYDLAASELEQSDQPGAAIEFLTTLAKNVPWDASFRLRLAEAEMKSGKGVAQAQVSFRAMAASADVPYSLRLQSAHDLAATPGGAAALGSAELNLIAASSHDVQAAQRPYFAASRLAVARYAPTAAGRAGVLREALAIEPQGPGADEARSGIFEAEFDAGNNALAAAAIAPVIGQLLNGPSTSAPISATVPIVDREKLADQVATVYERLGNDAEASQYLRDAIQLAANTGRKAALEARLRRIEDALAVEGENTERRPVIGKALDQSNLVRPRVTAVARAQGQVTP